MLQVAVVSSVSTEALADTSVVVADTSSRALLQYVGTSSSLCHGNGGSTGSRSGGHQIQVTGIVGEVDGARQDCRTGGSAGDGGVLDDSVGDSLKTSIDESGTGGSIKNEGSDGSGGEGLTVVIDVGKGEVTGGTVSSSTRGDDKCLGLVNLAIIEGVGVLGAKSLLARVTRVSVVANASLVAKTIPKVVGVASGGGSDLGEDSRGRGGGQSVGEVNNVSAHSVSAARVGADSSLASASLISIEADALTGGTVAESLVGALHVGVGLTDSKVSSVLLKGSVVPLGVDGGHVDLTIVVQVSLGRVNEGLAVLASALGAVVTSPVAVAGAHIVGTAGTMPRAHVVALSSSVGDSDGS